MGKRPHLGPGERQEEGELRSPSCALQLPQFAKRLEEAGGGTCPDATQSVWELRGPWTQVATAPGAIPARAGLVQSVGAHTAHPLAPRPLGRQPAEPEEPLARDSPQAVPRTARSLLVGLSPREARNGSKKGMSEFPLVGTFPSPFVYQH